MKKIIAHIKPLIMKAQYDAASSLWELVKRNFFEIELFIVIALTLNVYKRIPYINLIISPFIYYLGLTFIAIRLFRLSVKQIGALVMGVFFVMATLSVYHANEQVAMIADVVYFVLCYLCLKMIIDLKK